MQTRRAKGSRSGISKGEVMYTRSFSAMFSAVRLLFKSWRVLFVLLLLWAGLLTAVYLFASTREATISQLVLTLVVIIAAPALFFVLQALSISYAEEQVSA